MCVCVCVCRLLAHQDDADIDEPWSPPAGQRLGAGDPPASGHDDTGGTAPQQAKSLKCDE